MNVPRSLGRLLESAGHHWRHVADLNLHHADDREIVAIAETSHEVIITHDLDFGYLLAISGDVRPSVVIFRQHNLHPQELYHSLITTAESWGPAVEEGAIVIVEDGALRIRPLPISRQR
jgi:predicted nuclease of predicted toxin-antitoxin system